MSMFECRVNGVKTRKRFSDLSAAIIKGKRFYLVKTSRVSPS
jgi:hypothetical protein